MHINIKFSEAQGSLLQAVIWLSTKECWLVIIGPIAYTRAQLGHSSFAMTICIQTITSILKTHPFYNIVNCIIIVMISANHFSCYLLISMLLLFL